MRRIILVTVALILASIPFTATAQESSECPVMTGDSPPRLVYEPAVEEDLGEIFSSQVVDYLNTSGSIEGLSETIATASGEEFPIIKADVFEASISAEGAQNALVSVNVRWGGTFDNILIVLGCVDSQFVALETLVQVGFIDGREDPPTRIVAVQDLNGDFQAEVVQRFTIALNRPGETVTIFEWREDGLEAVFMTGTRGEFSAVEVSAADENRALVIRNFWSYGEIPSYIRPIERRYAWDEDDMGYALVCQFFTDEPTTRFEALHSAETYRVCGDAEAAMGFYQALTDDASELEGWTSEYALEAPADVEDTTAYVAQIEESYLRAFAYYRIVQLQVADDDLEAAQMTLVAAQSEYPVGTRGYQYVAMGAAFVQTYEEGHDFEAACEAAASTFEQVYHSADDPGYERYNEELTDGTVFQREFYYADGGVLSSDPDNVFEVPENVADMVQIPICIE